MKKSNNNPQKELTEYEKFRQEYYTWLGKGIKDRMQELSYDISKLSLLTGIKEKRLQEYIDGQRSLGIIHSVFLCRALRVKQKFFLMPDPKEAEMLKKLGEKIRKRMEELKIDHTTVVKETGIDEDTVIRYMYGRESLDFSHICFLASVLKIDELSFFTDIGS